MSVTARALLVAIAAVAAVALCVALGLWQVGRMREKQAARSAFEARMSKEPRPVGTTEPGEVVVAQGVYDLEHQVLLSARSHAGDPGVGVLTPLRLADGRAVLVDRGWLPAPDALTANPEKFPEPGVQRVVGLAGRIPASAERTRWVRVPSERAELWSTNSLALDSLATRWPYPLSLVTITQLPGPDVPLRPRREAPEAPDPSVNFWYAVQWFAIALIVALGSVAAGRRRAPLTD